MIHLPDPFNLTYWLRLHIYNGLSYLEIFPSGETLNNLAIIIVNIIDVIAAIVILYLAFIIITIIRDMRSNYDLEPILKEADSSNTSSRFTIYYPYYFWEFKKKHFLKSLHRGSSVYFDGKYTVDHVLDDTKRSSTKFKNKKFKLLRRKHAVKVQINE